MKKVTLIIGIASLTFASCHKDILGLKKDKPKPEALSAPTTVKSATVSDYSTNFGTKKVIGAYDYTTGNRTIMIGPDFTIGGTVNISKIKNFYFTLRKSDSTEIYRSDINQYTAAFMHGQTWVPLPKGSTYTMTLYADIDSGAIGTITTKIHTEFNASDTSGWMNETTGQTITVQLYKNSPTVTSMGSSVKVVNGDFATLNSTKIKSSVSNPTAVKQTSFQASFANNSGAGVMRFDSLRVFLNDEDVTGKWILVDDLGTTITSISQNSPSKVFHAVAITGDPAEAIIPQNAEFDITIKGVVRGFGGDTLISDVASIIAIKDVAAMQSGWTYLNRGSVGWHVKLYNSWVPSGSAKPVAFAWSPMKYQPHDPNFGSQVPDWYNSYGISFSATSFILHS